MTRNPLSHISAIFFILAFSFFCPTTFAQEAWTVEEENVNTDVWIPFIRAYNQLDARAFMDVHSSDFTRVLRAGGEIFGKEKYSERMYASAGRNKEQGQIRNLALSFHERILSSEKGFETGIYRVYVTRGNGDTAEYYGRFHVLLTREDDKWKLQMDADIDLPEEEGKEAFEKGRILEVL